MERVGRGDLNARPPVPKGSEIGSRRSVEFREFLTFTTIGNLLSLNEQVHRMERIGLRTQFWHSGKAGASAYLTIIRTFEPFERPEMCAAKSARNRIRSSAGMGLSEIPFADSAVQRGG